MAHDIEYGTTGKPHPYHLVRPSIWPLISAFAGGLFGLMMVMYFPDFRAAMSKGEPAPFPWGPAVGVAAIMLCMFFWWKDIIFETIHEKVHNGITEIGLRFGMALFIASEVMFFVAFFWAYFDASLFVTEVHQYLRLEKTGGIWPPAGIEAIPAFDLPFLMTMILLLSGCTVTWAHHAILEGKNKEAILGLGLSWGLGLIFLCFQMYEYHHATFPFRDGIFSSTFYMATGFHGFHVFVGTVFLFVCWLRARKGHFTPTRHFGFEAAAWYWHFVDVVWLFLFVAIYWWGGAGAIH
jgi:cytochrome c oxidase subunit III